MTTLIELGERAKAAALELAVVGTAEKNGALAAIEEALLAQSAMLLAENEADVRSAAAQGMRDSLLDRLKLDRQRIEGIAAGVKVVRDLADPVGEIIEERQRPNGIVIRKIRVPLGAIGIIYEARPNVTVDAAVLCLKAGNAVLLRGSSSARRSNRALTDVLRAALQRSGLPEDAVQLVEDDGRESVELLCRLSRHLDAILPRGGAALIKHVVASATVPVIETGAGNCHAYVEADADLNMAMALVLNAKTQRPSVCNAIETLLIHQDWPCERLTALLTALSVQGVELRGCPRTCAVFPGAKPAVEADWGTEYCDLIIAVKIVAGVDEAIAHINKYGTRHSEMIISASLKLAQRSQERVDAAAVYHNASTRFTDGFEFGFGAEIGISTQKLHARGPMGLKELTTYKYVIAGQGQVRN